MTSIAEYKERRAKWTDALRSGEYRQASGFLVTMVKDLKSDPLGADMCEGFCCLGVGGKLAGIPYVTKLSGSASHGTGFRTQTGVGDGKHYVDWKNGSATPEITEWLGLRDSQGEFYQSIKWTDGDEHAHYCNLADMNDSGNYSFIEIADFIDTNPAGLWAAGTYEAEAVAA